MCRYINIGRFEMKRSQMELDGEIEDVMREGIKPILSNTILRSRSSHITLIGICSMCIYILNIGCGSR